MEIAGLVLAIAGLIFGFYAWYKPRQLESVVRDGDIENLLEEITSSKKMRVGFFNYPPLITEPELSGEPAGGLYGRMTEILGLKNGIEITWVPMNISETTAAVLERKVEVIACVFQTAERSKYVDFTAFLHSVTVGGVSRASEKQIRSQSDLMASDKKVAVCRGEIGHEFVERIVAIPRKRLLVLDTDKISRVMALVKSGQADIALSDSVSIKNYLDGHNDDCPRLKSLFRARPLAICPNGAMIPRGQSDLGEWLDSEYRKVREEPEIRNIEEALLNEYKGIISQL